MPNSLAELTTDLKRIYQDATTVSCERALNRAYRRALRRMPGLARKSTDLTLVVGTRSYDLPAECGAVVGAAYLSAAATGSWLAYSPREKLNDVGTVWSVAASGTPAAYFIESDVSAGVTSQLKIVIDPAPDSAPSAGYPTVRVYLTEAQPLVTASTLPEGIISPDFWLYQAAAYIAQEIRPGRLAEFQGLADNELEEMAAAWRGLPRQVEEASTYTRQGKH